MAKATKTCKEVKVTLELNLHEAFTLSAILQRIGGSINDSPRAYTNEISSALKNIGIDTCMGENYTLENNRAIYFKDNAMKLIDDYVKDYGVLNG